MDLNQTRYVHAYLFSAYAYKFDVAKSNDFEAIAMRFANISRNSLCWLYFGKRLSPLVPVLQKSQ